MTRSALTWVSALMLALTALAGCTEAAPEVKPNPDMMVDPASPTAGEHVEVRFPDEPLRGLRYVLEHWTDDSWEPLYTLRAGNNGSGDATWWPVAEDRPIGAIGIVGPGPDLVVIPSDAESGTYRLCTDVVEDQTAVELENTTRCTPVVVE